MVRAKALRGTLQSITSGYLGVIGLYKNDYFFLLIFEIFIKFIEFLKALKNRKSSGNKAALK